MPSALLCMWDCAAPGVFQIVLNLNKPKLNCPVSDSGTLNQRWLLSRVEAESLVPHGETRCRHGVYRDPHDARLTSLDSQSESPIAKLDLRPSKRQGRAQPQPRGSGSD